MTATDIIRHVLVVRFRQGAGSEPIQAFFDEFRALTHRIDGIVSFEYGENNSPENLNRGLTHMIVLTFANAAARDAYLPHPEHQKFGEFLGKLNILDELVVLDYIPQE